MKRLIKAAIVLVVLAILMFAEYRIIMLNICPSYGADGFLHLEVFGSIDTYYIE
jgi:hypothetical protein